MRKLIVTVGLPGSGKTTWAKLYQQRKLTFGVTTVIVCKDDIRKELSKTGWEWSPENEKVVIDKRDAAIRTAFANGAVVVISADTNFGKHQAHLQELAKQLKVHYEVKSFTGVPVDQCIARDAARDVTDRVGETVITAMYNKYIVNSAPKPYVPDIRKPPAVICDLDGTLAIAQGRSPYEYTKVINDKVNEPIALLVNLLARNGYVILYVSGREDSCRLATEYWLDNNRLPIKEPNVLMMRKAKDYRKDYIVKQEIFDASIRDHYNVKFVLDDRNQVVAMWRRLGLTCLQVAEGNF